MTPELVYALIDTELGTPIHGRGLIGMHPQLAFVYMHALASRMASSVMCPLTDDDFDHVAAGCAAGRIASALLDSSARQPAQENRAEDFAPQFAMLALQSVIPKDIGSLPVQKIIEIRRRHIDELTSFQQASQTVVSSIPEALASATPEAGAMYLQSLFDKTLEPELLQLKESLRRSGVDAVLGSMSVKVESPQLLTTGAAALGFGAAHLNPLMMGVGAIILCLVPGVRRRRKEAQQLRAASPAAYLLRLEEELQPASLASDMTEKAKRLMTA
jgi:hypothetical protein